MSGTSGKRLCLAVPPVTDDQLLISAPTTILIRELRPGEQPTRPELSISPKRSITLDAQVTNELWNKLLELKLARGRLPERTFWQGISMWQFLPSYLWPELHRAVEYIEVLKKIQVEFAPAEVHAFESGDRMNRIWIAAVHEVFEEDRVFELRSSSSDTGSGIFPRAHQIAGKVFRRFELYRDRARVLGQFLKTKKKPRQGGKKLLFATHSRYWVPLPNDSTRKHDEHLGSLLPALRQAGWTDFLAIDCPYAPDTEKMIERILAEDADITWRTFDSYLFGERLRALALRPRFLSMWKEISSDPALKDRFRYQGVRLFPMLEPILEKGFSRILPDCAVFLKAAETMIDAEKPDAVMTVYETGPYQRALNLQAQKRGIPAVGLMHGMLFEGHYDYMHSRVSSDPSAAAIGIPDSTCVWGERWKKSVTRSGHYPENSVAVTGSWRHDFYLEFARRFDREALRRQLGIEPSSRLVLISSGGVNVPRYLEKSISAIRSVAGLVPIIKLHPADVREPVEEIMRKLDLDPKCLVEGGIFQVLAQADIVLSQPSTVISEALLLRKPVVLVNFEKNMEIAGRYVDTGACYYADSREALCEVIRQGSERNWKSETIEDAQERFIRDFFHGADGHSAERVAEVLERLSSKRT